MCACAHTFTTTEDAAATAIFRISPMLVVVIASINGWNEEELVFMHWNECLLWCCCSNAFTLWRHDGLHVSGEDCQGDSAH